MGWWFAHGCALVGLADERSSNDKVAFFESHVRPVLVEHCYECHSAETGESEGGLRLDGPAVMRSGGTRGAAVVPGDAEASLLIHAIRYDDPEMEMPPSGRLDQADIDHLVRWVTDGAVDPRNDAAGLSEASTASPMSRSPSSHWAFVPPKPMDASLWQPWIERQGHQAADSQDPLDELARWRAMDAGLTVNPPASKETLLRRLMFDLTGLPPTRDDIRSFVDDHRPNAVARRIDSLLSNVQFAERFARHWLDVARYADTKGYATAGKDRTLVGSHRYRDWVIGAFADDMPYPEMVRHQLAGDRTDPNNSNGHLDAMGFLTVGRHFLRPDDTLDDRIDVISRGLLGLTVACARCHDHKFDPIPTTDYYALYSVLDNSVPPPAKDDDKDGEKTPDAMAGASPLMLVDRKPLRPTRVMIRGNRGNRGDVAPRQYLTSFRQPDAPEFSIGSGRLDLASQIVDPTNPLTSRVMVNRIWGHLMGRHLVDTPSDFGYRTAPPAIAEVLDDLAAEFAQHGSIKKLVRRIVMTRMYQQSSHVDEASLAIDPENHYWARAERRRRDFESMRDGLLHAAVMLDRTIGGPSVDITATTMAPRRTLYALIDRQNLPGLFRTFDFANPDMHSPKRYATTVPQQSLYLMNHPHLMQLSRHTARVIRSERGEPDEWIEAAFARVLSRVPTDAERHRAKSFLSTPAEPPPPSTDPRMHWTYGTATLVDDALSDFKPMTWFENGRWQTSQTFPGEGPLRYASLSKRNGHPGHGDAGVVVRRWTSPINGVATVTGLLGHESQQGDGVDAIIRIGGNVVFRERQFSNRRPIRNIKGSVRAGEYVELIVHSRDNTSFDSFFWEAGIRVKNAKGALVEASSMSDFSGPIAATPPAGLDRLEQLIQVLFLSNEFAFVD